MFFGTGHFLLDGDLDAGYLASKVVQVELKVNKALVHIIYATGVLAGQFIKGLFICT